MAQLTRNEVITRAHRRIGVLTDGKLSSEQLADGIELLNTIMREESQRGVRRGNANLWAMQHRSLILQEGKYIYAPTTILTSELPTNIESLESAVYRDKNGDDCPLKQLTAQEYDRLEDKDAEGDPKHVYLEFRKTPTVGTSLYQLSSLYVHPVPTSLADYDVISNHSITYTCIKSHTASAYNEPGGVNSAGQGAHGGNRNNWRLFWDEQGDRANDPAWVTATDYTGAQCIVLTYKRPLNEFTSPRDNPDMPPGWDRFLILRLAYDLAFDYGVDLQERVILKSEYTDARLELFPGSHAQSNNHRNKAVYF
jgi:hypothetical protein